jgi:hypothetical protein
MSISTYAELKTSVLDFAHRSDLSTVIDTLVTRAESAINRKLRLLSQEQRTTLSTVEGSRFVDLPAGFLQMINLQLVVNGPAIELAPMPVSVIDGNVVTNLKGIPRVYRVGQTIEFEIAANAVYTLNAHWFKKWDIANDGSNWLLTNHPDVYMDMVLAEVGVFTRDQDMMQMHSALAGSKVEALISSDQKIRNATLSPVDSALVAPGRFNILRGY